MCTSAVYKTHKSDSSFFRTRGGPGAGLGWMALVLCAESHFDSTWLGWYREKDVQTEMCLQIVSEHSVVYKALYTINYFTLILPTVSQGRHRLVTFFFLRQEVLHWKRLSSLPKVSATARPGPSTASFKFCVLSLPPLHYPSLIGCVIMTQDWSCSTYESQRSLLGEVLENTWYKCSYTLLFQWQTGSDKVRHHSHTTVPLFPHPTPCLSFFCHSSLYDILEKFKKMLTLSKHPSTKIFPFRSAHCHQLLCQQLFKGCEN